MLGFDTTITVYTAVYNKNTGFDDYHRTLITNCSWFGKHGARQGDGGFSADKLFKVRILEGFSQAEKEYVPPDSYTNPDTQYTLMPGTVVVRGEGPSAPGNGKELAALTANQTDAFTVLDVHDNRRVGAMHFYVEGK